MEIVVIYTRVRKRACTQLSCTMYGTTVRGGSCYRAHGSTSQCRTYPVRYKQPDNVVARKRGDGEGVKAVYFGRHFDALIVFSQ